MTRLLTQDLPGTSGRIKQAPEDFRVEEVPAQEFTGKGPFLLTLVEKKGITSYEMVTRLARRLGVPEAQLGIAGIKDARAVTRQWVSLPASVEARLADLDVADVRILQHTRHRTKLRPGQLKGNRFDILVRTRAGDAHPRAQAILDVLARRGVPNYFGEQRFGTKGDTDRIGRALLCFDFDEALHWFLGAPSDQERDQRVKDARRAFDEGRHEGLTYPKWMRNERRVFDTFQKTGRATKALATLPRNLRLLFLSAYQSRLFNHCLDARLEELDVVWNGDVAVTHPRSEDFLVEDAAAEQDRADRFEISPAGPLFGPTLMRAQGRAGELEDSVFQEEGLDPEVEQTPYRDVHLKGERRAYRFPLREVSVEKDPAGLRLRFELPRGCYATTVLAEVMKTDASQPD